MDTKKELITINGKPLPKDPSSYEANSSTMVDEGVSVSGLKLGSVIRPKVSQISLSWNYLTTEEWAQIHALLDESRYSNDVTFFDQTLGDYRTCTMYVSDRSAGLWRRNSAGEVLGWTGCSLQLTEV